MDLAGAISNYTQAQTATSAQTLVAAKVLQSARQQGQDDVALIEAASGRGGGAQAGDSLVAQATGLGGSLDTYG